MLKLFNWENGAAKRVKPREEGGGYYDKRFTSSFVGFIPVENPQLAIIVVADDPVSIQRMI